MILKIPGKYIVLGLLITIAATFIGLSKSPRDRVTADANSSNNTEDNNLTIANSLAGKKQETIHNVPQKAIEPITPPQKRTRMTKEAIYSCEEKTKANQEVCQLALNFLGDRFPGIDLDAVQWSDIPKIYSCYGIERGIEANFNWNSKNLEVEFDLSGSFLETEYEREPIANLPPQVKTAFEQHLANNQPKLKQGQKQLNDYDFFELEQTNENELHYEFEIDKDLDADITFDDRGIVTLNRCED